VVETKVDRLIHLGDTNLFRDFPRPKPDLGDLTAVVEQDGGEGHFDGCEFWISQLWVFGAGGREPKPGGALMPERFRLNPARRVVMWIKSLPFLILINDVFIPTPVGRRTILTSHLPLCP